MPFLKAGFNARNYDTGIRGWTRHVRSRRGYAPAELRRFASGDYFWYGETALGAFLTWGESVIFRSLVICRGLHPCCDLATREERLWAW